MKMRDVMCVPCSGRGLDSGCEVESARNSVEELVLRAVIHLTYWADLEPQQVADTLGTSLRTVERELTNARTRLEAILS